MPPDTDTQSGTSSDGKTLGKAVAILYDKAASAKRSGRWIIATILSVGPISAWVTNLTGREGRHGRIDALTQEVRATHRDVIRTRQFAEGLLGVVKELKGGPEALKRYNSKAAAKAAAAKPKPVADTLFVPPLEADSSLSVSYPDQPFLKPIAQNQ